MCHDRTDITVAQIEHAFHDVLLDFLHFADIKAFFDNRLDLLLRHLAGAQIQAPVHLPGVGGDDLPAEALGQLHPQPALAAGGGTQHHNQLGQRHGRHILSSLVSLSL